MLLLNWCTNKSHINKTIIRKAPHKKFKVINYLDANHALVYLFWLVFIFTVAVCVLVSASPSGVRRCRCVWLWELRFGSDAAKGSTRVFWCVLIKSGRRVNLLIQHHCRASEKQNVPINATFILHLNKSPNAQNASELCFNLSNISQLLGRNEWVTNRTFSECPGDALLKLSTSVILVMLIELTIRVIYL